MPGALVFLVGGGAEEVEGELVGIDLGEEVATARELFQIEERVFLKVMHGFDVAWVGVRGGREAHRLAVTESFGKVALELAAIAIQVLLDARSEDHAGRHTALLRESPDKQATADFPCGVPDDR